MATASMLGFFAVSIMLVITPGADWAYTITAGLRHRSIAPAIAGLMAGYVLITAAVALGAAALISSTPGATAALTVVGASYLAWLGMNNLRSPATISTSDEVATASESVSSQVLRGLATSGLNPKALLLFLAMLPQFTDAHGTLPLGAQLTVLGAIHMTSATVVYIIVGLSARRLLRSRPSAAMAVSRFSGVAMLLIAFGLLAEHLHIF